VEEHTRENISRIMKVLHYTPSQTARNLSMKSSSTVGVIVPEISNTFFGELFSGVEEVTKRHNLSLLYNPYPYRYHFQNIAEISYASL
jgi:LacI family transcriptional regulator